SSGKIGRTKPFFELTRATIDGCDAVEANSLRTSNQAMLASDLKHLSFGQSSNTRRSGVFRGRPFRVYSAVVRIYARSSARTFWGAAFACASTDVLACTMICAPVSAAVSEAK